PAPRPRGDWGPVLVRLGLVPRRRQPAPSAFPTSVMFHWRTSSSAPAGSSGDLAMASTAMSDLRDGLSDRRSSANSSTVLPVYSSANSACPSVISSGLNLTSLVRSSVMPSPSSQAPVRERPCGYVVQPRSEEHTSELQSRENLVCRLLLEKKK